MPGIEVKNLLSKEVRRLQGERKADKDAQDALSEHAKEHLAQATSELISTTRTLRQLGQWQPVPSFCEIAALQFDVRGMTDYLNKDSVSHQAADWAERHRGVTQAERNANVRGMRQSRCCVAGTCVCGRTRQSRRASSLRSSALKVMQTHLFNSKAAEKFLLDAEVVILWICHTENKVVLDHCVSFIPCHYRRPWRPTFLQLRVHASSKASLLNRCSMLLDDAAVLRPLLDEYYAFEVVLDEFAGPSFKTVPELFLEFDMRSCWSMSIMYLSQRAAPLPHGVGLVKAFSAHDAAAFPFWTVADVNADFGAWDDEDPKDDPGKVDAKDAFSEGEENDEDEDIVKGDEKMKSEEGISGFDEEFLSFWDNLTDVKDKKDNFSTEAKLSSSSSDSSSSSTSGSSSDSDSDVLVKHEAAVAESKVEHDVPKTASTGKFRRDLGNFIPFGPHHLTARYSGGSISGYAMACRHPGHVRCSRELAATVAGGLPQARQALQAWIILGANLPNRESHMSAEMRQILTEALESQSLLPEEDLVHIITSLDAGLESPFRPSAPPSNPDNITLGRRATDVPAAFHEQMLQMARRGQIPSTTLAQRQRNRRHASNYRVPVDLELAFQFGYISPNLPPPAGVRWVCKAGEWTLVPRGG